jgi:hypothetical protein
MEMEDDCEDRTWTPVEWIKELIRVIRTKTGKSLITGNFIIIEIPDYLDDENKQ